MIIEQVKTTGKVLSLFAAFAILLACGDGINDKSSSIPMKVTNDLDGDGIANSEDVDIDGDGVDNEFDAFELDATEWADTDGDGIGDNSDKNSTYNNENITESGGELFHYISVSSPQPKKRSTNEYL
ncbi:hypothetical protein [Thalassotalea crassostreae]|uniref:hypothetical protein n=1 Tax=Thalassotalea crassostreae TaxID=1763536 RepID=UPI0008399CD2|nr:hypothetical protein [Thalassotalea crassostreae]